MTGQEQFARFDHKGYAWTAAPAFVEVIRNDPRVLEPGDAPAKEGARSAVWHFAPRGFDEGVYVRRRRISSFVERILYALRPSYATREFRAAIELARRGISVPEPLAVGVSRAGRPNAGTIFILRAVPSAEPVDKFVRERMSDARHAAVAAFTAGFAEFLKGMHDAGVTHRSFRPADILVRSDAEHEGPQFVLASLHGVRMGARGTLSRRIHSLQALGRFFCQTVPRHWRLRFLKAFLEGHGNLAKAAEAIERAALAGLRRDWTRQDARFCGNNRHFHHMAAGPFTGRARRTPLAKAALRLFEDGDPFPRAEGVIKDSPESTVGVFKVHVGGAERRIVIKRQVPRLGFKSAFDLCRASRSMKGFFYGMAAEHRGIPTPQAIGALDDRRLVFHRRSYLIQEFVENAETLEDAMAAGEDSPLYRQFQADRPGFLGGFARMLRRMHSSGLSMRDLKATNVLLHPRADGGVAISLIDLDGARLYRGGVPRSRAMQNIARLYVDADNAGAFTPQDAVFFLNEYLGHPGPAEVERWIAGIEKRAKRVREMVRRRTVRSLKSEV